MNYIGSKYSLLDDIGRVLDASGVPTDGIALDLFAGTGVVAQMLKRRGHVAYANDWQHYSYLTNLALVESSHPPEFTALLADADVRGAVDSAVSEHGCLADPRPLDLVLAYLNSLRGTEGRFYQAYCQGGTAGRLYFSRANGLKIQAVRDKIEQWSGAGLIGSSERAWLIACLLEAADRVANTASVYGAYLKHVKKSAQRPLLLQCLAPVESAHDGHRAFCADGEKLLRQLSDTRLRLVYIDPPYNARQYNSNYHILETIARWDLAGFDPRGVTGLRPKSENRSDYCSKTRVETAFRRLLGKMNTDYVLFSYNDEGLVPGDTLRAIVGGFCDEVNFREIVYKRFRADLDGENRVYKGDLTREYLILGKYRRSEFAPGIGVGAAAGAATE